MSKQQHFRSAVERLFDAEDDVIKGFSYEAYRRYKRGENDYGGSVLVSHLGFENVCPRYEEERQLFIDNNRYPVMWQHYRLDHSRAQVPEGYCRTIRKVIKKLPNVSRTIIGETRCMFGSVLTTVPKLSNDLQISEDAVKKGLNTLYNFGILKDKVSFKTRLTYLSVNELKSILKTLNVKLSGNKNDLIDRIVDKTEESNVLNLLPSYVLTQELLELNWELPGNFMEYMDY